MAKLRVFPSPFVSVSKNSLVIDQDLRNEPTLEIDLKEVSLRPTTELLRIKTVADDGTYTYFWISIGLNKKGYPLVEVANERDGYTTRKKVLGKCERKGEPIT